MKKSCSGNESKVIASKDVAEVLNESKEEQLTEEQLYINKKLTECGIDKEGLGWLEKRNICKTINVSLNTAGGERSQRTSPRFAKPCNLKATNANSNSFDNKRDEKSSKLRTSEASIEVTTNKKSSLSTNKLSQEQKDPSTKFNHSKEDTKDAEVNGSSPKLCKKVHYIKIQVEENTKEEINAPIVGCSKEKDSPKLCVNKKRSSPPETQTVDAAKKLKMEDTNNYVPSEEIPLKVELELERRRKNSPFVVRDIKTIVAECERRNKKWKETFLNYKWPARWGVPISRCFDEKWDGKRIPTKLLQKYQKYLSCNDMCHPVFFPVKSQNICELNKFDHEICSLSSAGTVESKEELDNDFKDDSEVSFSKDEPKKSGVENNLNASTSGISSRMVLRNRTQQKPIIMDDEDEYSSDDFDEWFSGKKSNKKQKINSKNKKTNQNKQLVLKLEKCNLNKKEVENGVKNANESFSSGNVLENESLSQVDGSLKSGPDPDTMVCPICSLRFKKQLIESHATECASKTYKD